VSGEGPRLKHEGDTGLLSRAATFAPPPGTLLERPGAPGYYLDFSMKAPSPSWPPPWLQSGAPVMCVTVAQFGLGSFERYVKGEGEEFLSSARRAAEWLIANRIEGGRLDGGLPHRFGMPHTYEIHPPWLSAMAQGQAASLLARLRVELGEDELGAAASRALSPLRVPVSEGGVLAELGGRPFFEEYPTDPGSFVLNGAIFTIWGLRDVARCLDDGEVAAELETATEALAANLDRWDIGYWSRYDLFPHPLPNVSSEAYHHLHITQLRVMAALTPDPSFADLARRFSAYADDRGDRVRALAAKVAFRLAVPRNRLLARRMPWRHRGRNSR
jgi:heparosan-N-sulfate-glucuronate 5-epimerase